MTYEASEPASTTSRGRYAYSPLGNTGLMRADLPSKVKGSYEGYTYATATDLTIYGGDLTIKIDWSVDASDVDTTGIEVMISDLTDSDGMGWIDSDGVDDTEDPIVASITFVSQDMSQLVAFSSAEEMGNTLDAADEEITGTGDDAENVAGFNQAYDRNDALFENFIKLVYDDDSEVYAGGNVNGQFLGVSAADSGNADQPRAIIGQWDIDAMRLETTPNGTSTSLTPGTPRSTLEGVYGADLVVVP